MAQLRPARIREAVQPTTPDMGPSHNLECPCPLLSGADHQYRLNALVQGLFLFYRQGS